MPDNEGFMRNCGPVLGGIYATRFGDLQPMMQSSEEDNKI